MNQKPKKLKNIEKRSTCLIATKMELLRLKVTVFNERLLLSLLLKNDFYFNISIRLRQNNEKIRTKFNR